MSGANVSESVPTVLERVVEERNPWRSINATEVAQHRNHVADWLPLLNKDSNCGHHSSAEFDVRAATPSPVKAADGCGTFAQIRGDLDQGF